MMEIAMLNLSVPRLRGWSTNNEGYLTKEFRKDSRKVTFRKTTVRRISKAEKGSIYADLAAVSSSKIFQE